MDWRESNVRHDELDDHPPRLAQRHRREQPVPPAIRRRLLERNGSHILVSLPPRARIKPFRDHPPRIIPTDPCLLYPEVGGES